MLRWWDELQDNLVVSTELIYMNVNWLPEIVSKSDVSSVGGQFTLPTQLMILNYPESMNSCLIGWLESDDVTSVMTTIFWKGTLCIRLLSSIEKERNKQIKEYYQEIITFYYLLVLVSLVLWIIIIIVSVLRTSVLFKFQFCLFFFFTRALEEDVRLLGILNEQYEDRDTLISEISKEVC